MKLRIILRRLSLLLTALFAVSACVSYNITTEIPIKEKITSAAVLIRIADTSKISREEYTTSFRIIDKGIGNKSNIVYLKDDGKFSIYKNSTDRFYQEAANNQFLKYKSLGTLRVFTAENESELKGYIEQSGVDALIIYEIGGSYSASLKAMKFDSLIVVLDRQLDVVYLDHQKSYIGDAEYDRDAVRTEFLDNLTNRWQETIRALGLISVE